MSIRYVNVAVFMIWSLTLHNSRLINIVQDTTPCTTDLQKPKFTKFYQTDQLLWELYNRECGEGLTECEE